MNDLPTSSHESGRLGLPFVGHCTFAKAPACLDWDAINADVAVLGVPNDMGTISARRTLWSARYPRGLHAVFLRARRRVRLRRRRDRMPAERVSMVDIGDADIVHTDMTKSHANTEYAVRKILEAEALRSFSVITPFMRLP